MRRQAQQLALLCALAAVVTSCEVPSEQTEFCDGEDTTIAVTGAITAGRTDLVPKVLPIEVKGKLTSAYLVQALTVGGVPADGVAANYADWSVKLGEAELEANRDGDLAQIDVVATDLCGKPHTVDSMQIPLWPSPGVTVSGLDMSLTILPEGECSLPASGSSSAIVRVTASAASLRGKVTLSATRGSFAGGGATVDLLLAKDGQDTSATAYFIPSSAGAALITAAVDGSTVKAVTLLVTAAPEMLPATLTAKAGSTYNLQVRTRGNLATCFAQAPQPGVVTFAAVSPDFGTIDGVTSIEADVVSCQDLEIVQIQAKLDPAAPSGATATLHCTDTFGQESTATLTVAPP